MKPNFRQLMRQSDAVKLSGDEKMNARANLARFMAAHPLPESALSVPIWQRWLNVSSLALRPVMVAVVILAVLATGGGFVYAAEDALPGEALYAVKVHVNEEVRGVLKTGGEAKVQWEAERVERRLQEAEMLAAAGRLDTKTSVQIAAQVKVQSNRMQREIEKLRGAGKEEFVVDVSERFETHLETHAALLAHIDATIVKEGNVGKETKEAVEALLKPIEQERMLSARARGHAETKIHAEGGKIEAAATGKIMAAEDAVTEAEEVVVKIKEKFGDVATRNLEKQIEKAKDRLREAKGDLEVEAYGQAFTSAQEARHAAQSAQVTAETQGRLRMDLTPTSTKNIPSRLIPLEIKKTNESATKARLRNLLRSQKNEDRVIKPNKNEPPEEIKIEQKREENLIQIKNNTEVPVNTNPLQKIDPTEIDVRNRGVIRMGL